MENYDVAEVAEKIMDEIRREFRELNSLNIVVLGKTGAGKSTLINNLFGEKLAETGSGRPVTRSIRKLRKRDFPLVLYDTPGLELTGENSVDGLLQEITDLIAESCETGDVSEAIHCVLYCINTAAHRVEPAEIELLRKLTESPKIPRIPVIAVLTQAFSRKEAVSLRQALEKEQLSLAGVCTVLAEDYEIDENYRVRAYGLDRLSERIDAVLPDAVRNTFVYVEIADIRMKQLRAQKAVQTAALTAAAIGAVPIPFSDASLIVPNQITMLAKITNIFGLPVQKASITGVLTATIGTAGTTVLGRTAVANLTKLIPGIGSIAGGAISAGTAAILTAALGEAYIILLTEVVKGELSIDDLGKQRGMDEIRRIFRERLSMRRGKDKPEDRNDNGKGSQ